MKELQEEAYSAWLEIHGELQGDSIERVEGFHVCILKEGGRRV